MLCVAVLTWYWEPACQGTATHHHTRQERRALTCHLHQPAGQHDTLTQLRTVRSQIQQHFYISSLTSVKPANIFIFQKETTGSWTKFLSHFGWHPSNKEIIKQEFLAIEIPGLTQTETDQDIWARPGPGPCQCQGFYLLQHKHEALFLCQDIIGFTTTITEYLQNKIQHLILKYHIVKMSGEI